jgi:ATP-dependent Lhr-like helicase
MTAALGHVAPQLLDEWSFSNLSVSLRSDATATAVSAALREARARFGDDWAGIEPEMSDQALKKLKFSELLPPQLATWTLAARSADHRGARLASALPVVTGAGPSL